MQISWQTGDPALRFVARSTNNKAFHFEAAAGRYVVLCFFGSATFAKHKAAHDHILSRRAALDDDKVSFFGVSVDADDETQQRVQPAMPGIRYFWDFDGKISALYGACADTTKPLNNYSGFTLVLDPLQRVMGCFSMADVAAHNAAYDALIAALPSVDQHAAVPVHAPVLVLPRVFEPEFCQHLIGLYESHGGEDSGFMRQIDGKTVGILDHNFKRRKDFHFDHEPDHEALRQSIRNRLIKRMLPEIKKAFQYDATRIERYVVSCYDAEVGGYFRPHRDNTTAGTAHRRFACSFNLNAEDYDGGDLRFPEFGSKTYRAPTGGVVVFSCSPLHEATPVTRGKRYAFLPFLYDDEAAKIRRQNAHLITEAPTEAPSAS